MSSSSSDDGMLLAADHRLVPGLVLGDRFRLGCLLGAGGMGEVYTARDLLLETTVALKVVRTDLVGQPETYSSLLEEARASRQVSHPNVCRVHDVHEAEVHGERLVFLTMELLHGETLAERLGRSPRLTVAETTAIALELCDALQAVHFSGIVHGDIKTSNVMLSERGGTAKAILMDFGLTRALEAGSVPASGSPPGTLAYMAPERRAGDRQTAAADVWALGLVLAQVLTGLQFPAALDAVSETSGAPGGYQLSLPAEAMLGLHNPGWLKIVQLCLDSNPGNRPSSLSTLRAQLSARPSPASRRSPAAVGLVLALSMALLIFLLRVPANDVAVLPFVNSSGDPSLDYAADGLGMSLQEAVVRSSNLRVAPFSLAQKWRGPQLVPAVVGQELRTRFFVRGLLRAKGSELLLGVELVDTSSGRAVWWRRYKCAVTELGQLERSLVTDLGPHLPRNTGLPVPLAHARDGAATLP